MYSDDRGGAGDRKRRVRPPRDAENPYVKRKLGNGLPIPVFVRDSCDDDGDTFASCQNLPNPPSCEAFDNDCDDEFCTTRFPQSKLKTSMEILREYYTCPICFDPCIEATTTNCGHKFCRACLEQWKAHKPICPICSTLISSQHRLFTDDLFIEAHLQYLSQEVQDRFRNAQKSRVQTLYKDQNSRNVMKAVRRKLDSSLTYWKSKSVANLRDAMQTRASRMINSIPEFNNTGLGVVVGLVIGVMIMIIFNNTTFLHYMWLAVKNYDGTIPPQWIITPPDIVIDPPEPEPFDPMEAFINLVNPIRHLRSWG